MLKHTVLLKDGSIGVVYGDHTCGEIVLVVAQDENGNTIKVAGEIVEILE